MKEPPTKSYHPRHQSLLDRLLEVEQAVRPEADLDLEALRSQLTEMRTEAFAHFQAEELEGPVGALARSEPRFERSVRRLIEEHRELEQSLETLMEAAAVAERVDEPLVAKVRRWVQRARRHEIDEDELLMAAANQDLGPVD
jgi:hypothetical protein